MAVHRRRSDEFFPVLMATWGLDAHAAELLWACIPREGKEVLRYHIDKALNRNERTPAGKAAIAALLRAMDPHGLIISVEDAIADGTIDRDAGNGIIDVLLANMTAGGEWTP